MQPLDLQRLIQIIVEEIAASESAPAPSRCNCHSLLYECCPDRLRGVLDAHVESCFFSENNWFFFADRFAFWIPDDREAGLFLDDLSRNELHS